MLEAISALCRVLACEARLIILYHLSQEAELSVTELARRANMSADLASQHLRRLTAARLVEPKLPFHSILEIRSSLNKDSRLLRQHSGQLSLPFYTRSVRWFLVMGNRWMTSQLLLAFERFNMTLTAASCLTDNRSK